MKRALKIKSARWLDCMVFIVLHYHLFLSNSIFGPLPLGVIILGRRIVRTRSLHRSSTLAKRSHRRSSAFARCTHGSCRHRALNFVLKYYGVSTISKIGVEEPPEVHTARMNPRSTQKKNETPEVHGFPEVQKKRQKPPRSTIISFSKCP